MFRWYKVLIVWVLTAIGTFFITPLIKKIAFKLGAVDTPNKRRVNIKATPSLGGLGIYLSMFFFLFFVQPIPNDYLMPIFVGSTIIVITGIIDDVYELSASKKLIGQLLASLVPYFYGIRVELINIPYFGEIVVSPLISLVGSVIWIIAITNAVNLIDGLDGLASGVSIISLSTIGIINFFLQTSERLTLTIVIFSLVFSILGFLPYNFHPASIFLGDTGSMFLGYSAALFSLYGVKRATFLSLVIPLVILGVPITDTFFAIIRRKLNKKPIMAPDRNHLHHRLLHLGLSHRETVLTIYGISAIFALVALIYPVSTAWGAIVLTIGLLIGLEFFIEFIGLFGENRRPLIQLAKNIITGIKLKEPKGRDQQ